MPCGTRLVESQAKRMPTEMCVEKSTKGRQSCLSHAPRAVVLLANRGTDRIVRPVGSTCAHLKDLAELPSRMTANSPFIPAADDLPNQRNFDDSINSTMYRREIVCETSGFTHCFRPAWRAVVGLKRPTDLSTRLVGVPRCDDSNLQSICSRCWAAGSRIGSGDCGSRGGMQLRRRLGWRHDGPRSDAPL